MGSFALPVLLHVLALVVDCEAKNQTQGTSIKRLVATAAVTVYSVQCHCLDLPTRVPVPVPVEIQR
jgi:hypothetical protein